MVARTYNKATAPRIASGNPPWENTSLTKLWTQLQLETVDNDNTPPNRVADDGGARTRRYTRESWNDCNTPK